MSENEWIAQIALTIDLVILSIMGPERFLVLWAKLVSVIRRLYGYRDVDHS